MGYNFKNVNTMNKKEKKYTETFCFRMTRREREELENNAARGGMTPSELLRDLINKGEFISTNQN